MGDELHRIETIVLHNSWISLAAVVLRLDRRLHRDRVRAIRDTVGRRDSPVLATGTPAVGAVVLDGAQAPVQYSDAWDTGFAVRVLEEQDGRRREELRRQAESCRDDRIIGRRQ